MNFQRYITQKYAAEKKKTVKAKTVNAEPYKVSKHKIPANIKKILLISEEPTLWDEARYAEYGLTFAEKIDPAYEPSEIIKPLSIIKGAPLPVGSDRSYSDMTPRQRNSYLTFLEDITQKSAFGYVNLLFYALERSIYLDVEIKKAVLILKKLQTYHKFPRFHQRCNDLLTIAALKTKDWITFRKLDLYALHPEVFFTVKVTFEQAFTVTDLMFLAKAVGFDRTKFIHLQPELFSKQLQQLLLDRTGMKTLTIPKNKVFETEELTELPLTNPSLPETQLQFPNLISDPEIKSTIYQLLDEAEQRVEKIWYLPKNLRLRRSKPKPFMSIPERSYPIIEGESSFEERLAAVEIEEDVPSDYEIKLADDYFIRERYQEAEQWMLRAIKKDKHLLRFYYRLSVFYHKQKWYTTEAAVLKQGLTHFPNNKRLSPRLRKAELLEKHTADKAKE